MPVWLVCPPSGTFDSVPPTSRCMPASGQPPSATIGHEADVLEVRVVWSKGTGGRTARHRGGVRARRPVRKYPGQCVHPSRKPKLSRGSAHRGPDPQREERCLRWCPASFHEEGLPGSRAGLEKSDYTHLTAPVKGDFWIGCSSAWIAGWLWSFTPNSRGWWLIARWGGTIGGGGIRLFSIGSVPGSESSTASAAEGDPMNQTRPWVSSNAGDIDMPPAGIAVLAANGQLRATP